MLSPNTRDRMILRNTIRWDPEVKGSYAKVMRQVKRDGDVTALVKSARRKEMVGREKDALMWEAFRSLFSVEGDGMKMRCGLPSTLWSLLKSRTMMF